MKKIAEYMLLLLVILTLSCGKREEHVHAEISQKYTCPMHPQIVRDQPGTCPICGMDLVKVDAAREERALRLNESQLQLANITTSPARFERLSNNTLLAGKLMVDEEQTTAVSSRVEGRIEKLYVKEAGKSIARGQPLYSIYSERLLTLEQEYLLAARQFAELKENQFALFLAAAKRKLMLFGMTHEQVAELTLRGTADAQMIFRSPVSGTVAEIVATEGQYVSEGSALYRIENLDRIWAEAELFSGETALVKIGDLVKVRTSGADHPTVEGKVTFINPEYRQGSQTTTLRAVMANPKHEFLPGMQISVILTHAEKNVIVVPTDAVIRDGTGSHVWILENDESFHLRMVTLGRENVDSVEIIQGIEENENVAVTGAYLLYGELVLKRGGDMVTAHRH